MSKWEETYIWDYAMNGFEGGCVLSNYPMQSADSFAQRL